MTDISIETAQVADAALHLRRGFASAADMQARDALYLKHLDSSKWRRTRKRILRRDGYRCRTCGAAHDLRVHHVTYANLGSEGDDDLITLCAHCHGAVEQVIRAQRGQSQEGTHAPA